MSEGCPGSARLAFQGARSRRSTCNEGSLWRYQSLISANWFAPTANAVRAGFPATLPERWSEERILGAHFARLPLSAARARAPGGERLTATASGPTAVIVRRLSKNKSIQAKLAETQAHMGSS